MHSLLVVTLHGHAVLPAARVRPTSPPPDGAAAGGADGPALRLALDALRGRADVQVHDVALPGDLDGVLHRKGSRTLVVAGNDAALHRVVSALHRRTELDETVLAMLPLGADNDFARGAGIPSDPVEAARAVVEGVERRFDLIQDCRGEIAVKGAAVGARPRRALAGLRELSGVEAIGDLATRPVRVQVVADDRVVTDLDRPIVGLRVGSASGTDRADGLADVVVSFAATGLRGRVWQALRVGGDGGRTVGETIRVRARKVTVAGQWFALATDGQQSGEERRCTWTVMPGRLRLIVPKDAA